MKDFPKTWNKNHQKRVKLIRTNHFHIFYCTGKPVHKTTCFLNFYFLKLLSISIFKVQDTSNGSICLHVVLMNQDSEHLLKRTLAVFCVLLKY